MCYIASGPHTPIGSEHLRPQTVRCYKTSGQTQFMYLRKYTFVKSINRLRHHNLRTFRGFDQCSHLRLNSLTPWELPADSRLVKTNEVSMLTPIRDSVKMV